VERPETLKRSRDLLVRIVDSSKGALVRLLDDPTQIDRAEALKNLLRVLDEVATRVFFSLDGGSRTNGTPALEDSSQRALYFELKPVIERLTSSPLGETRRNLLAPASAHYLMQLLNGVLSFDPSAVVGFAAAVCRASKPLNYQFDSMAVGEMVKLVEHVLADHREILRETPTADSLGEMLDIFVSAGWPQAMSLTFRLDEVVR
jgi:hypothetical protein